MLNPKDPAPDAPINASGHAQELDRNFHLVNICGLGVTSGNTWIGISGSIVRRLCKRWRMTVLISS